MILKFITLQGDCGSEIVTTYINLHSNSLLVLLMKTLVKWS